MPDANIDPDVVRGFGEEWTHFDQSALTSEEFRRTFDAYFRVFPWDRLQPDAEGFDLGCGSGRWARGVAPRVGTLHCIDPSEALEVAKRNLADLPNCLFHRASVSEIPLADASMDFGYSLGVLHHVPDPAAGLRDCVAKLKSGAPFLVYLYYAMDNQPAWYRGLWRMSEAGRRLISRLGRGPRIALTTFIAATVYWPLARTAKFLARAGMPVKSFPLSIYRDYSFYVMRTDALDRLGTRLEQRFTRHQIEEMMRAVGLRDIVFSEAAPYWCAVGFRR